MTPTVASSYFAMPGPNVKASGSAASIRSSSAIVVAQLRIVIDLYAGVPAQPCTTHSMIS